MRLTLLISIFCYSFFAVQSQTVQHEISGRIIDENKIALPYANVALFASADSTLVTGAVSDDDGRFVILTNAGKFYLRISFFFMKKKY